MKRIVAVKQSKTGAAAHLRTINTTASTLKKAESSMTLDARDVPVFVDTAKLDFTGSPTYRKSAVVKARPSVAGERLVTVLADGTVETSRDSLPADQMVVTNPGGEQYAIPMATFKEKYTPGKKYGVYEAVGKIRAMKNPTGAPITVMAPWGEEQHGGPDCWIAESGDDRYIIGAAEFNETYWLETDPPAPANLVAGNNGVSVRGLSQSSGNPRPIPLPRRRKR